MKLTVRHPGHAAGVSHLLPLRLLGAALGYAGGAVAYAGAVCFTTCVLEGRLAAPNSLPQTAIWLAAFFAGPLGALYGAIRLPRWVSRN